MHWTVRIYGAFFVSRMAVKTLQKKKAILRRSLWSAALWCCKTSPWRIKVCTAAELRSSPKSTRTPLQKSWSMVSITSERKKQKKISNSLILCLLQCWLCFCMSPSEKLNICLYFSRRASVPQRLLQEWACQHSGCPRRQEKTGVWA